MCDPLFVRKHECDYLCVRKEVALSVWVWLKRPDLGLPRAVISLRGSGRGGEGALGDLSIAEGQEPSVASSLLPCDTTKREHADSILRHRGGFKPPTMEGEGGGVGGGSTKHRATQIPTQSTSVFCLRRLFVCLFCLIVCLFVLSDCLFGKGTVSAHRIR